MKRQTVQLIFLQSDEQTRLRQTDGEITKTRKAEIRKRIAS